VDISVVGTGYVGLTSAACLAHRGHRVYAVGIDEESIKRINSGIPTIYEEGLDEILRAATSGGRLVATTDFRNSIAESAVVFICVGTPGREDGSIDLSQLKAASREVGRSVTEKEDYCVIVVKSTVVPGTTDEVVIPIIEESSGKKAGCDFGVCVNPEFLREGSAIKDFLSPKDQGIVIGELDKKSGDVLCRLYEDFAAEILRTTLRTAEMIKYARNAYLAKDVSFANEIANLCQKLSVDYLNVKKGMEMDSRIGKGRFLNAGLGFGGSCFPKDVKAIIAKAREVDADMRMLEATLAVNESQPLVMISMLNQIFGDLREKKIAVLGLAFKPGTDDMRESRSIPLINELLRRGACVHAFDPEAMSRAKEILGDNVFYAERVEDALRDADACLIVTEWPLFSDPKLYSSLKCKIVIDGRRALDPKILPPSLVYRCIGLPT
jgi:UDPglucose 6-dehydrogenase